MPPVTRRCAARSSVAPRSMRAQLERVPQVERELAGAAERLASIRERLKMLQGRRDETTIRESEHESLRGEYERATAEAHAAELALVQARGEETSAHSALERAH